jgi:vacuolar-type H+-ATPase subunit E/Vma4
MTDIDKLHKIYQDAEQRAQKLMAERDEQIQKISDRFNERLRQANQQAAEHQKAWLDAQVAQSLLDRPDGERLAAALGIELPE